MIFRSHVAGRFTSSSGGAILAGLLIPLLGAASAGAAIINVPTDQPTIQAGIDAANPDDEVVIADGTYTGAGNVDLDFLGKAITVRGANGAGSCTIDCENAARAFSFFTGEDMASVLQGIKIVNGKAEDGSGGAILCIETSPTILDCIFEDNTAFTVDGEFPNGSGGAIFSTGGSPVIEGCTFIGNIAGFDASPIGTGFGGAIFFFLGGGAVTDCVFDGNLADGPGGFGNGIGGGVFVLFASPNFAGCTFNGNSAVIAGGGIWLQGSTTTDIGHCAFDGNTAQSGGGLAVFEATATVHDSIFTNNSIASDDPIVQQRIGGAGIGCADTVTVTVTDCFFSGNVSADGVGGAFSSIGNSTATLTGCEFVENSAALTGGGVHNGTAPESEDEDLILPSTMTITGCVFDGNTAEGGGGGASNTDGSTLSVLTCDFQHNTSFTATGPFTTGSGGGLTSIGSATTIEGSTFTENTAGFEGSAGGTGFGGGVFMFLGGGSLTDCTFSGNLADGPGGFGNGIGGGVFVLFASPNFAGCTFNGNSAVIAGGGIWLQGTATTDIGHCAFDGNTAQSGGGLAVFQAAATVHDSSFTNNSIASDDPIVQQRIGGGAIGSADRVIVSITDCFFSGNVSADGVGGAVSTIGNSTAALVRCEFRGNTAATTGGAVHTGTAPDSGDENLVLPSTTTMSDCLMACNTAGTMGGGIFTGNGSSLLMINGTLGHNFAFGGGGLATVGESVDEPPVPSSSVLVNSILWGNESASVAGHQIIDGAGATMTEVTYSIVQRGWPGDGNSKRNPRWVDADEHQCPDGNYRLSRNSPAIDAGNNGVVTEEFDLDGGPRIVGDVVDMGAYERDHDTF